MTIAGVKGLFEKTQLLDLSPAQEKLPFAECCYGNKRADHGIGVHIRRGHLHAKPFQPVA